MRPLQRCMVRVGANGIIMITTKKGTSGKARVNFDAKWGANSRGVKNYDVLTSSKNYLEKAYEAIYNGYVLTNGMTPQAANVAANKYFAFCWKWWCRLSDLYSA